MAVKIFNPNFETAIQELEDQEKLKYENAEILKADLDPVNKDKPNLSELTEPANIDLSKAFT